MRVIPPLAVTTVTSSTIPEEVAATYAGGTTYAAGDLAGAASTYGAAQTVWRSKQAGNIGHAQVEGDWWEDAGIVYPVFASGSSCGVGGIVTDLANHDLYESLVVGNTGNALSDVTKWKYIGKTNRYRMFDYTRNNKSTVPGEMTIVVTPGKRIDSIGLAGIQANSYSISVSSAAGGGVVYTASGSLNTRKVVTWYEHLTTAFTTQKSLVYFDIPPFSDCVVTLTLTATTGDVELAAFGVGKYEYLGAASLGGGDDVLNFSNVDRDIDGNAIMTVRRSIPKLNLTILCDKARVDIARRVRETLNGAPAFWYAIDDPTHGYFESMSLAPAFYRGFEINNDYPENALIQLEVEQV